MLPSARWQLATRASLIHCGDGASQLLAAGLIGAGRCKMSRQSCACGGTLCARHFPMAAKLDDEPESNLRVLSLSVLDNQEI
jgi:hypothetical protein